MFHKHLKIQCSQFVRNFSIKRRMRPSTMAFQSRNYILLVSSNVGLEIPQRQLTKLASPDSSHIFINLTIFKLLFINVYWQINLIFRYNIFSDSITVFYLFQYKYPYHKFPYVVKNDVLSTVNIMKP